MGFEVFVIGEEECCPGDDRCTNIVEITFAETFTRFNLDEQYVEKTGQTLRGLIDGKRLGDTADILSNLISKFDITLDPDPYAPEYGNGGRFAMKLLSFVNKYPNGKWKIQE